MCLFWSFWRFCLLSMVIFTNCILSFLRDESVMAFTTATLMDPYNTLYQEMTSPLPRSDLSHVHASLVNYISFVKISNCG